MPVVVSYTTGQYLDIALTTVQYGIYCPGAAVALIYVIGRIQVIVIPRHRGFIAENHPIPRAQPEGEVWFSAINPWYRYYNYILLLIGPWNSLHGNK